MNVHKQKIELKRQSSARDKRLIKNNIRLLKKSMAKSPIIKQADFILLLNIVIEIEKRIR